MFQCDRAWIGAVGTAFDPAAKQIGNTPGADSLRVGGDYVLLEIALYRLSPGQEDEFFPPLPQPATRLFASRSASSAVL